MGLKQPTQSDVHGGFFRQGEAPSGQNGQASATEISEGQHQARFGADPAAGSVFDAVPGSVCMLPIDSFCDISDAGPDADVSVKVVQYSAGDGECAVASVAGCVKEAVVRERAIPETGAPDAFIVEGADAFEVSAEAGFPVEGHQHQSCRPIVGGQVFPDGNACNGRKAPLPPANSLGGLRYWDGRQRFRCGGYLREGDEFVLRQDGICATALRRGRLVGLPDSFKTGALLLGHHSGAALEGFSEVGKFGKKVFDRVGGDGFTLQGPCLEFEATLADGFVLVERLVPAVGDRRGALPGENQKQGGKECGYVSFQTAHSSCKIRKKIRYCQLV